MILATSRCIETQPRRLLIHHEVTFAGETGLAEYRAALAARGRDPREARTPLPGRGLEDASPVFQGAPARSGSVAEPGSGWGLPTAYDAAAEIIDSALLRQAADSVTMSADTGWAFAVSVLAVAPWRTRVDRAVR